MRCLKTLPESDCSWEPTWGMMLCYEGLISVLLEIISNDFCVHEFVCMCVFLPLYLASMDLFTSLFASWWLIESL